ncbi:MAG: hypothetical protein KF797_07255, partial [Flavobacteriales bacterium]|nr:hypothetical protein [Flavobacteriales bacterium]
MSEPEQFLVRPGLIVPVTSDFRIESFDRIYYAYSVKFLEKARDHEARLGQLIDTSLINNCALSLLLSALGLESHINDFGQKQLGENYFKAVDRLSPPSKYRIVTDLVAGKKNWLPEHYVGELKRLFTLRDKLVHYKSINVDPIKNQTVRKEYFIEEKELGIRCFELVVLKL